jgi:hypothetical protein
MQTWRWRAIRWVLAAAAIGGCLGLGCASTPHSQAFNEADYQPFLRPGNSTIMGHAFLRVSVAKVWDGADLAV